MALRAVRVVCFVSLGFWLAGSGCEALGPRHRQIRPATSVRTIVPWDGFELSWPAVPLPSTTPWDLAALSEPPQYEWSDWGESVWSLYYQGLPYRGRPTRVFAYYASPATLDPARTPNRGFPGVVLVHGGGGTAFKQWAEIWARRGYAAIAMDLAGCGPDRQRLDDGGPGQSDQEKFGAIDGPPEDQWTYHAVADVILAHSLLRSFPEVDARRTAVTGISWGGYLTCLVAGLDNRFQAAVPVYGCGFLHENSVWLGRFEQMTPEQRDKWVTLWDPSRYIGSAQMPMLFLDGTNDFAYPLDSYAKTYGLVQHGRNLRITVNMPHGHPQGWAPIEIGLFVDQYLRGGKPLPVISRPRTDDDQIRAKVTAETELVAAALHYTTESGPINKRQWQTVAARMAGTYLVAPAPPAEATIWFLTVTDQRGAVVSSELVFGPEQ